MLLPFFLQVDYSLIVFIREIQVENVIYFVHIFFHYLALLLHTLRCYVNKVYEFK